MENTGWQWSNVYKHSLQDAVKAHMDVIGLAISSGQARAATLQIGSGQDHTQYTLNGVLLPDSHAISHQLTGPDSVNMQVQLDVMNAQLFKYLLDVLSAYKYGDKTLLDFGCVMLTSEVGDGMTHSHTDIPHIIAGSCKGALKQGLYVDVGTQTNNRILNTIGAAVGLKTGEAPLEDFGDESLKRGRLMELVS